MLRLVAAATALTSLSACAPPQPEAASPQRHEAESGRTSGALHGPSRHYLTPDAEASGRAYVRLEREGDFIEWVAQAPANAIVIRFCIPDAADGGGVESSLEVVVNGQQRARIALTSRHAWVYGDFPWTNDPSAGRAHRFFDEAHGLIGPVAPGDTVRLQVPRGATAYHLVDLVELEQVPLPRPRPGGSLSITEFGAAPDDGADDSTALVAALSAARASGRTLWIPPGDFVLAGARINLPGVRMTGAGPWHSRFVGPRTMFEGLGEAVHVSDLAIFGEVDRRVDNIPENAFHGNFGHGSLLERLWIEHVKCGLWTTFGTRGLVLRDSRLRNLMADGVNFCDGTSDSRVERCHVRNSGDDALATWSPTTPDAAGHPCERNSFVDNLVEIPWLANGIAVYGGRDHTVAGNRIRGTVFSGAGVAVSSGFAALELGGNIVIEKNLIESTGGDSHFGQRLGGVSIQARDSDIAAAISIRDMTIIESAGGGLSFHGPKSCGLTTVERCTVEAAPFGLEVHDNAKGGVVLDSFTMRDVPGGLLDNRSSGAFGVTVRGDDEGFR